MRSGSEYGLDQRRDLLAQDIVNFERNLRGDRHFKTNRRRKLEWIRVIP